MPTSRKPTPPLCTYALSHFHIRMLVSCPTSVSTSSVHAPALCPMLTAMSLCPLPLTYAYLVPSAPMFTLCYDNTCT